MKDAVLFLLLVIFSSCNFDADRFLTLQIGDSVELTEKKILELQRAGFLSKKLRFFDGSDSVKVRPIYCGGAYKYMEGIEFQTRNPKKTMDYLLRNTNLPKEEIKTHSKEDRFGILSSEVDTFLYIYSCKIAYNENYKQVVCND